MFFLPFLVFRPNSMGSSPAGVQSGVWYSGWIPNPVEPGGELVHAQWQAPVAKKDTSDVHGFSPARRKTKAKEFSSSSDEDCTNHLCKKNYRFDALQAYCFGINIKL